MPGFTEIGLITAVLLLCETLLPRESQSHLPSFSNQLAHLWSADFNSCHVFTSEHLSYSNILSKHNLGNGETARWLRVDASLAED